MIKRLKILWYRYVCHRTWRELSKVMGGDGNQLHGQDLHRWALFQSTKYGFH